MEDIEQIAAGILLVLCDGKEHTGDDLIEELWIQGRFMAILEFYKKKYDDLTLRFPKITERREVAKQPARSDISRAIHGRKGKPNSLSLMRMGLVEITSLPNTTPIKYKVIKERIAEIFSTLKNWGGAGLLEMFVRSELFRDYWARLPYNKLFTDMIELEKENHIIDHVSEKVLQIFLSSARTLWLGKLMKNGVIIRTRDDENIRARQWGKTVALASASPATLEYLLNLVGKPFQQYYEEKERFQRNKTRTEADYDSILLSVGNFLATFDFHKIYEDCKLLFAHDRMKSALLSNGGILGLLDGFLVLPDDLKVNISLEYHGHIIDYLDATDPDEETKADREMVAFKDGLEHAKDKSKYMRDRGAWDAIASGSKKKKK